MDAERGRPVLRAIRETDSPIKHTKPPYKKKTISVASVFKRQAHKTTQTDVPKKDAEDASVEKMTSAKSHSSSHSPKKANSRVTKRRSDMHPLAMAFRETTDDYRRHLYKSTTLKINKTLEVLLLRLFESTLQIMPTSTRGHDPKVSPLKLSAPAKYERMAKKLYQPLSQYRLSLSRTNAQGEKERFQATLETRMTHYEEHLNQHRKELAALQKEWETVVGELWKLGVTCLGKDEMEALLLTNKDAAGLSPSPSQATVAESTLFVPSQGSSPPRKTRISKKHVSFENLSNTGSKGDVAPTPQVPAFLVQPSKFRNKPLAIVAPVAERDVKKLEATINELGRKQIEELRKIEKDHKDYWRKKNAALASALKDD